jgi:hypothetical protein
MKGINFLKEETYDPTSTNVLLLLLLLLLKGHFYVSIYN